MSIFGNLFEDQYKSSTLLEFIEGIIRQMADLKRQNHYDQLKIDGREKEINRIKEALNELKIDISEDFDPDSYREDD